MQPAAQLLAASLFPLAFLAAWGIGRLARRAWRDTRRDWHLLRHASDELHRLALREYPGLFREHTVTADCRTDDPGMEQCLSRGAKQQLVESDIRTVHLAFVRGANDGRLRRLRAGAVRRIANRALTLVLTAAVLLLLAQNWRILLS